MKGVIGDPLAGYRGDAITSCCGRPTSVDHAQVEVRSLPDPPRTTCRFVTLSRWQCLVVKAHRGGWSTFTDVELPRG